jgi:hypothetical protein
MKLGCISAIVFFVVLSLGGAFIIPIFIKGNDQHFKAGKILGKFATLASIPVFAIGFVIQKRRESAG